MCSHTFIRCVFVSSSAVELVHPSPIVPFLPSQDVIAERVQKVGGAPGLPTYRREQQKSRVAVGWPSLVRSHTFSSYLLQAAFCSHTLEPPDPSDELACGGSNVWLQTTKGGGVINGEKWKA